MDDVTHGWVPADSMEGGFPSTGNEIIGAVSAAAAAASALHQTAGQRDDGAAWLKVAWQASRYACSYSQAVAQ